MDPTVPSRDEIAPEHTWDIASVFPTDQAWEAEMSQVATELAALDRFRGRLGDSPTILADWLESSEQLRNRVGIIGLFARLGYQADTTNQAEAAKADDEGRPAEAVSDRDAVH